MKTKENPRALEKTYNPPFFICIHIETTQKPIHAPPWYGKIQSILRVCEIIICRLLLIWKFIKEVV